MDEADVESRGALADAARREAHALRGEPFDRGVQIVDPHAHVVERGLVHLRALRRVDRLHEVDLDRERPRPRHRDVLVDVLALASELPAQREAEQVDPQPAQRLLVEPTDGDLLEAENPERSRGHCSFPLLGPAPRAAAPTALPA